MEEKIIEKGSIVNEVSNVMNDFFDAYSVMTCNGTIAIEVALKALGLKRGSHVLLSDLSFIATGTAIANLGLIPVFVDSSCRTLGLTLDIVKSECSKNSKIKAVIVVHFAGRVNRDIAAIAKFCKEKKIFLIEDCAQVFGGSYKGVKCGTFGDFGTFSFQTSKVITCGEGGMVITTNLSLAKKARQISDWGLDEQYNRAYDLCVGNYRINPLGAAYLKKQMQKHEEIIKNRRCIYQKAVKIAKEMGRIIIELEEDKDVFDIPFFLLAKNSHPRHFLYPVGEYPMNQSKYIYTIISSLYGDLLKEYIEVNSKFLHSFTEEFIRGTDFIGIYMILDGDVEEKFRL